MIDENSALVKMQHSTEESRGGYGSASMDSEHASTDIISDKIDAFSAEINTVSAEIKTVSDKIDAVSAEIKTVSDKIDAVSAEIKTVSADLNKATSAPEQQRLTEELQNLTEDRSRLIANEEKLRTRQTGLENRQKGLERILNGHLEEQSDLRSQLKKLRFLSPAMFAGGAGGGADGDEGAQMTKKLKTDSGTVKSGSAAGSRAASVLGQEEWENVKQQLKVAVSEEGDHTFDELKRKLTDEEQRFWRIEPDNPESKLYHETQKYQAVIKWLETCVPENFRQYPNSGVRIEVAKKLSIKLSVPLLERTLACQQDIILRHGRFLGNVGAIMSVEVKAKQLKDEYLPQCELEAILLARDSRFPTIQVLTDMMSGGVAYWLEENTSDGFTQLTRETLPTMDNLKSFISNVFEEMPELARFKKVADIPQTLNSPSRQKFIAPTNWQLHALTRVLNREQDLEGFDEILEPHLHCSLDITSQRLPP